MYADDTCVTTSSENLNNLVTDLKVSLKYIKQDGNRQTSLNASEIEFMVVNHSRKLNKVGKELPNLVLNDKVIKRVEKIKYLGIDIGESLNWEGQY